MYLLIFAFKLSCLCDVVYCVYAMWRLWYLSSVVFVILLAYCVMHTVANGCVLLLDTNKVCFYKFGET